MVFESNWDLAGALQVAYQEPTIKADVVTPNLEVGEEGVSTTLYGSLHSSYPYDHGLLVYNRQDDRVHRLPDAPSARRYFAASKPGQDEGCVPGHEDFGAPVLDPLLSSKKDAVYIGKSYAFKG